MFPQIQCIPAPFEWVSRPGGTYSESFGASAVPVDSSSDAVFVWQSVSGDSAAALVAATASGSYYNTILAAPETESANVLATPISSASDYVWVNENSLSPETAAVSVAVTDSASSYIWVNENSLTPESAAALVQVIGSGSSP